MTVQVNSVMSGVKGNSRPNPEAMTRAESNSQTIKPIRVASLTQLKNTELRGEKVSIGEEQLIRAIDRAMSALRGPNTSIEISTHDATNHIMIKVMDKDTGELIREVPPEKTLDLVAKFIEIAGILIDEKV